MAEGYGSRWNRDTVVGLVGAVVLIGAMTGVFLYERGQFNEYPIDWQMTEAGSSQETGTLSAQSSETYTFTVDAEAVSRIRVSLDWTDDVGQADTFSLQVEGPDGQTGSAEGSQGTVEVDVPVGEQPTQDTAVGRSQEDAEAQARAAMVSTAGQGTWTVTVELTEAPGQQVAGTEVQGDGGNDYQLTFAYDVWDPQIQG